MRKVSNSLKKVRYCQLQQQREFWPVIAVGVAGLVAHYAVLAYLNQDNQDSGKYPEDASPVALQNSFGIDIGSSFSRVAIREVDKPIPFVIENREGNRSTPSTVLFPYGIKVTDHSLADTDDDSHVVGTTASKSRFIKPEKTYNCSSMLASTYNSSTIKIELSEIEKSYIYYLLAKDLKTSAQSKSDCAGALPTFVSVPNCFTAVQSSLLLSACRDAGFNCVASLPDAVSAVLGNIETDLYTPPYALKSKEHDTVFVIDVGGSIVQMSILLVKSMSNSIPIILAQKTLLDNGGNFFDEAIVNHLISEFAKLNNGMNIANDKMARQRLYDAAEAAKIELSTSSSSKILIPFITADQYGPKHLDYDMSRTQLNIVLEGLTKDIQSSYMEVLNDAKEQMLRTACREEDGGNRLDLNLAAVMVIGGGARMSIIKSRIQEIAGGVPLIISQQPEEIISIGAAAYSKIARY